uniref:Eukaryotic translation initiation factor 4E-binding protein 1 n=1 Tax=Castor canadensis TaxID=51338 RepID=A0A8C0W310_CASCN
MRENIRFLVFWARLTSLRMMLYQPPCALPGTRIIYDRKFLMECRNSPVAKTPPRDLPTIPGVTSPVSDEPPTEASQNHLRNSPEEKRAGGEESQFEMDI